MGSLLSLQLSCAVQIAENPVLREQADLPLGVEALIVRVEMCMDGGSLSLYKALKHNRDPLIAKHMVEVRRVPLEGYALVALVGIGSIVIFDQGMQVLPEGTRVNWSKVMQNAPINGDVVMFDHVLQAVPEGRRINWSKVMQNAPIKGDVVMFDHVLQAVPEGAEINWSKVMQNAAINGDPVMFDHVLQAVPEGAEINWGNVLEGAAISGWVEMFDHVLREAPDGTEINWGNVLEGAAGSGRIPMFERVFQAVPEGTGIRWNLVLFYAAVSGSIPMFERALQAVPEGFLLNWGICICGAAERGSVPMLEHVMQAAPEGLLRAATRRGRLLQRVRRVLSRRAQGILASALFSAVRSGSIAQFELIRQAIPRGHSIKWREVLRHAVHNGSIELVDHIVEILPEGIRPGPAEWDGLLRELESPNMRNPNPALIAHIRELRDRAE